MAPIFTTGDNVYPNGTVAEFADCYATTPWGGSVKSRTRPVPGNHDWGTGSHERTWSGTSATSAPTRMTAVARATTATTSRQQLARRQPRQRMPARARWRAGRRAAGSAQELWLEADLAANSGENVIAVWHKPRYSSGATNNQALQPLWDDLYAAGVDILLDGHDHIYERTAPMKSGATLVEPAGR